MQYQLDCECGARVAVAETAAGTTALCRCGREIPIPSLRELRRRAGVVEPSLPIESVVETLLLTGKLPEEDHCVLCGIATQTSICCTTQCGRAYVRDGRPSWWTYLLAFLAGGSDGIGAVSESAGKEREWGKNHIFPLPLRICDACRPGLTTPAEVKAALGRVPVYRQLLQKYPNARVSLPPT